jgi:hypothetical protein
VAIDTLMARARFVLRDAEHDLEIRIAWHVEHPLLASLLQSPPAVTGAGACCEQAEDLESHGSSLAQSR